MSAFGALLSRHGAAGHSTGLIAMSRAEQRKRSKDEVRSGPLAYCRLRETMTESLPRLAAGAGRVLGRRSRASNRYRSRLLLLLPCSKVRPGPAQCGLRRAVTAG